MYNSMKDGEARDAEASRERAQMQQSLALYEKDKEIAAFQLNQVVKNTTELKEMFAEFKKRPRYDADDAEGDFNPIREDIAAIKAQIIVLEKDKDSTDSRVRDLEYRLKSINEEQ